MRDHGVIAAKALEAVRASGASKVKVAVVDVDGVVRGKYMHRDKFLAAAGSPSATFGFCNVVFGWDCGDVCYDNSVYTGWHTGYPDAQARIDLGTYRQVPWEDDVPFFLADFVDAKGGPLPVCPRQLLKQVIGRAAAMGFRARFGLEYEWFNFRETPQTLVEKGYQALESLTPGMFGYSLLRAGQNQPFFQALMDELNAFDVPIEGLHTETGPGVFEAALAVDAALEAADRGALFKSGCKDIAHRFGIMPTFMAKWNSSLPGSSGHMHQSLCDTQGNNLFYQPDGRHRMSMLFQHYLAGQMACLPDILPMYAPTVNSYKRLVEGLWAPTTVTWGVDNRTSALRVIPGSATSTRLETRVAGADMNPYLGVAAALASGLYGIEQKLQLPSAPVEGNAYAQKGAPPLARDLGEAAARMAQSPVAKQLFGPAFVEHFCNSRQWEVRQARAAVTDWELRRYFEII